MRRGVLALVVLPSFALAPRAARACGGFFCSGQQIDQTGERVLFVIDEESGRVQAHIQIQFQGDANDFSWVVPVTVVPEFSAGSDDVFASLLGSTMPRFVREERYDDDCGYGGDADSDTDGDTDTDTGTSTGTGSGARDEVTVLAAGVAGPYETIVVDGTDPEALQDWLVENGFDVPDSSLPIIASYIEQGFYFAGLKLQKGQEAGDLRPIVLDMASDEACLPIRLTAIAATSDMPITIWVLANGQAVSTNYPEVWMNDLYLYMHDVPDYGAILNAALDEAGGRAFLVDYAGSPDEAADALRPDRYTTDLLAALDDPIAFMVELQRQGLNRHPLISGLLAAYLPVPDSLAAEGVSQEQFQQCVDCSSPCDDYYYGGCENACARCYGDELSALGYEFDAAGFAVAIEEAIVEPLQAAAASFARFSTLTRLFTTMSPSEMTEDPLFAVNADLPAVPLERRGARTYYCDGSGYGYSESRYEVVTPNGLRACWEGSWDFRPEGMPYAMFAIDQTERGAGRLSVDNRDTIGEAYPCAEPGSDPGVVSVTGGRFQTDGNPEPSVSASGGSLCSVAGTGAAASGFLLVAAIAAIGRRRR